MGRRLAGAGLIALIVAGCVDTSLAEPEALGPDAEAYLDLAVDVMRLNSVRRFEIDWAEFRARTKADAGNAQTTSETYPAIRSALERIGDEHSFFVTPDEAGGDDGPGVGPARGDDAPSSALLGGAIGYLDVPAFRGGGPEDDAHATAYHRLIEGVEAADPCGWVVDVRGNTGGNVWPMLAGVGPVLGEGPAGAFVHPDSLVQGWAYRDGLATLDGEGLAIAVPHHVGSGALPPVAVLTDARTASAGEGVAVAFRGRPHVRSFGVATRGLSTGNAGYGMPDGAVMYLTVARMADRDGAVYGGRLRPDTFVLGTKTGDRSTDAVLDAALTWLETAHCR